MVRGVALVSLCFALVSLYVVVSRFFLNRRYIWIFADKQVDFADKPIKIADKSGNFADNQKIADNPDDFAEKPQKIADKSNFSLIKLKTLQNLQVIAMPYTNK